MRLDLPDNPGKYLAASCYQDSQGNLGVSVLNRTPLPVTGVRFVVQYQNSSGTQRSERSVPGTIRAGESGAVSTGIGPYPAGAGCPVDVTAAMVDE